MQRKVETLWNPDVARPRSRVMRGVVRQQPVRMRAAWAILALGASAGATSAQAAVDSLNWRTHPAVVAVRGIYNAVERKAGGGAFQVQSREAVCYGGSARLEVTAFRDSTGAIRKYVVKGGSGDSAGEVRFYYDDRGALRFALELYGNVHGTRREIRAYYDEAAKPIFQDRRLLEGPDYPGGFELDVRDPEADFRDPC